MKNLKQIIPAVLLAGAMTAAPAFASSELAGTVQGNNGNVVYVGSNGRTYAIPSDAVFLVNGMRVNPYQLQPGTPVQTYQDGSLHEAGSYGGYHSDNYWRHRDWERRHGYWR